MPTKKTPWADLSKIGVRRFTRIGAPFQVFPFHQAFYPLLDHVDVGLEAVGQLLNHFRDELLVGKVFALPRVRSVSR